MTRRRDAFYVDGEQFRESRLIAGYDRKTAAESLGVTERTVRNWESRRVGVPYSAFKLMRILAGYELPGVAWQGWSILGDTLWSPERKGFRASEFNWWSLTVAMARDWKRLYRDRVSGSAQSAEVVDMNQTGVVDRNGFPLSGRGVYLVWPSAQVWSPGSRRVRGTTATAVRLRAAKRAQPDGEVAAVSFSVGSRIGEKL